MIYFNDLVQEQSMKRDNVALFLIFQALSNPTRNLCVGCVHVYYKDKYIQSHQVNDIIDKLQSIRSTYGNDIPIILCGG